MRRRATECGLLMLGILWTTVCSGQSTREAVTGAKEPSSERAGDAGFDFRNSSWGMSLKQVKASEATKPSAETDLKGKHLVSYKGAIAGFDASTLYIFVDGKLVRAKYIFKQMHSDKTEYISDYDSLKETLAKK